MARGVNGMRGLARARGPVAAMLLLGFAAGLPFPLVFSTFATWLRDSGVSPAKIGFMSAVGLVYTLKFLWAPLMDRLDAPLTGKLGRRRGWLLLCQLAVAGGLAGMGWAGTDHGLALLAALATATALASASQDVVLDAYRIEAVEARLQGLMAAAYIYGYRLAVLAAVAGVLLLADHFGWRAAYLAAACAMGVGVATTLCVREPAGRRRLRLSLFERMLLHRWCPRHARFWRLRAGLVLGIVAPLVDFFDRHRGHAAFLLALVLLYLLSDLLLGVMSGPFYIDLGFSKSEIAGAAKTVGLAAALAGAAVGGVLALRFGIARVLLAGAVLMALTNLAYATLAGRDAPSLWMLGGVVGADSFSGGLANVVFVAFLSALTHSGYTATQYALFSSLMKIPGKAAGVLSGLAVERWGYEAFFVLSAAAGLPAIVLCALLLRRRRHLPQDLAERLWAPTGVLNGGRRNTRPGR